MGAYRDIMLNGLCRTLAPRHMVLAGARDAALARAMLAAAMRAGATLHIVGAQPGETLRALRQEGGDACLVHDAPAASALGVLPVPGLCWVDVDPNWYTVQGVLAALAAQAARLGRDFPVVIVEGAGWPHGRRDGYDDPAGIPEAFRHPHERSGLLPGQAMPAGGAGLHAGGYHATAENEPRLGVLTAVEDFMEGRTDTLRCVRLPGFGGRVALTPRGLPGADAFAPVALAAYLHATADSLESARLDQAVALAAAEAALSRATALNGLLRAAASGRAAPEPPGHAGGAPAWRTRLRPAVRLARGLRKRIVHAGRQEGETPEQQEAREAARLRASPIFDGAWYLEQNGDVAAAGLDPAVHYVRAGAKELRDPGPFFSTAGYLAANADVAEADINPVLHYLSSGAAEGRALGAEFDAVAYLARHPELAERRENPLEHFIAAQEAMRSADQA